VRYRENLERTHDLVAVAGTVASLFWRQLAVLYSERRPAGPPPPEVVHARRQMAMGLAAFARALADNERDLAKVRAHGIAAPLAEVARRDPDMSDAIAAFERIRDGVLSALR
jgi:hypothetical protein